MRTCHGPKSPPRVHVYAFTENFRHRIVVPWHQSKKNGSYIFFARGQCLACHLNLHCKTNRNGLLGDKYKPRQNLGNLGIQRVEYFPTTLTHVSFVKVLGSRPHSQVSCSCFHCCIPVCRRHSWLAKKKYYLGSFFPTFTANFSIGESKQNDQIQTPINPSGIVECTEWNRVTPRITMLVSFIGVLGDLENQAPCSPSSRFLRSCFQWRAPIYLGRFQFI